MGISVITNYNYNPIISPETDPTQWDYIFPMSWGNSGYLRFSGRSPFGISAGRFLAPIAQNSNFLSQNAIFWPLIIGDLPVTVFAFPVIGNLPIIIVAFPVIGDLLIKSSGGTPAKINTDTPWYFWEDFRSLQFLCTVLHAIALLAMARGLCLARRLYTSWKLSIGLTHKTSTLY